MEEGGRDFEVKMSVEVLLKRGNLLVFRSGSSTSLTQFPIQFSFTFLNNSCSFKKVLIISQVNKS